VVDITPRVSVVIPAYNAANFLERALSSVLAQTMPEVEIIMVDDASSDATFEIARKVAVCDSRVRVLHNERNRGLAVTRNRAIGMARGEWIAFLDADDVWSRKRLEQMLAAADSADVVSDDVYFIYDSPTNPDKVKWLSLILRQGLAITRPHQLTLLEFARHDLGLLKPIVRRSFLQRHEFEFNPDLEATVDFHLYFEMLSAGARWIQLPTAYYLYYVHSNNMTRNILKLSQDVSESTKALLTHQVIREDAVVAALERREREWQSHAAFATVRSFLQQRRGAKLARLLLEHPTYGSLTIRRIVRSCWRRVLWRMRKLSKRYPTVDSSLLSEHNTFL